MYIDLSVIVYVITWVLTISGMGHYKIAKSVTPGTNDGLGRVFVSYIITHLLVMYLLIFR